jgi:hypothetical protein
VKNVFKVVWGPQKGANCMLSIHDMLVIFSIPKGPTKTLVCTVYETLNKNTWILTLGTLLQN